MPTTTSGEKFREFKVGEQYHLFNGIYRHKIYIDAVIITDKTWDGVVVVYRWYGKHKQWWHYECVSGWELDQKIQLAENINKKIKQ